MNRLHDARVSDARGRLDGRAKLGLRVGKAVRRRRQAEILGRQPANALAIHRELDRARGGNDFRDPFALDVGQRIRGDCLDLRHHELRPLLLDQPPQRGAIGHRDDMGAMRDLMTGSVGVAVDGDDFDPETLQRDDDLLAELAAAEQHHFGGRRGQGGADVHGLPLATFGHRRSPLDSSHSSSERAPDVALHTNTVVAR